VNELDYDVIVVGAGYSGITSARDLAERGLRTLVLEATDRVGGRGYTRPFKGYEDVHIECGGAWVNSELHPQVAAEVARYGVELTDEFDAPVDGSAFFTDGRLRSLPVSPENFGYVEAALLRVYEAARRFSVGYAVHLQPVADLDISAREFFAPLNMPQEVEDLVYAVIGAFSGTHPDRVSVLHVISKIAAFGYGPFGALLLQPLGMGPELQFRYGSTDLASKMISGSRAELRLSSPVRQISQPDDHVQVTVEGGERISAAACIVAVPGNAIKNIDFSPGLSREKAEVVAVDHHGRALKTFMIVEGIERAPLCIGLTNMLVVKPLRVLPDGRFLLVAFTASELAPLDPHDRDQVEAALRVYLPQARVVACDGHDWQADPFFRGAFQVDAPGRSLEVRRVMSQPEGRVLFSGSDLDEGIWRISFESAVRTGHKAATKAAVIVSAS
jgi:monoamine oxidase